MDKGPPLTPRALRAPEFWLLVVAALAATADLAAWIVFPLAVTGLSISALPKYIALWPRVRAAGAEQAWWVTVALSTFNTLAASSAAYLFGRFLGWLWF